MEQRYSSELFERAVDEFSKLPGVGRKSALRLVLHLLRMDVGAVDGFANAVSQLRHEVNYCRVCHNISDDEVCQICASPSRDRTLICVVENIRDVMAVEATNQYHGLYHVLGGVISPLDGIGPADHIHGAGLAAKQYRLLDVPHRPRIQLAVGQVFDFLLRVEAQCRDN